jgi:hypothetical protein
MISNQAIAKTTDALQRVEQLLAASQSGVIALLFPFCTCHRSFARTQTRERPVTNTMIASHSLKSGKRYLWRLVWRLDVWVIKARSFLSCLCLRVGGRTPPILLESSSSHGAAKQGRRTGPSQKPWPERSRCSSGVA